MESKFYKNQSSFCKTERTSIFRIPRWKIISRAKLQNLGFSIVFLLLFISGNGQTTPLNFTPIPFSSPEIIGPGRGAEDWYNSQLVGIPAASSPDSSLDSYWRFTWEDVQDYSTGAFKWAYFDYKVQQAIDGHRKFNFGIYAYNPSYGTNVGGSTLNYPLVVHNAMQAEPVYKDARDISSGYPGYNSWVPNWNAPSFRSYYNALQDAIIAHLKSTTYNGIRMYDAIGYVDIRTFGNTGEWTGYNLGNNPSYMPTNTVATAATQIQFIDDMVARWPDKQLQICIGAVLGTTVSDAPQGGDQVGYHVFTTTNSVGHIGLRRDCLGQTDAFVHQFLENNTTVYNGLVFKDAIMNNYKVAPFMGEPCNCCMIAGDPLNQGISYWDLPRQITFYHHASFGNGNLYLPGTAAQVAQEKDSVRRASKNAGYRLILTGGSMTTTLTSGSVFNVTLNWQNTGIAPTYENWNVVYELRSGSTVVWSGNSGMVLRLFLPSGSATPQSDNLTLGSVANGTYNLYLIIKDPTGYRRPLTLAIPGRNADGSYLLRSNITVGPGSGNLSPVANAGADQTIQLPTSNVTLTGTGTDPDGTIASYAWAKISGPAGSTISSPSTASTNITGLTQGVYLFGLTVTDNLGAIGIDTVQVTVNPAVANLAPIANAGADQTITLPVNSVTIDGSASSDPDGSISSYLWTKISGPTQLIIGNNGAATTLISNLTAGSYSFQLKVTDNLGATALDTIKVTVNPAPANQPPVANAGSDQTVTLPVNSVTIDGSASSDPDGSISSYLWTKISGPAQFTIGNSGAASTLVSNLIAGIYSFQLKVTDNGGAIALDTIKINVNPAPANLPPVANAGADISITLPTTVANLNGSASSDPDGTISAYAWSQVSGPGAASIASGTNANTGISGLVQGTYVFALKVTDNAGAVGLDSVKVTVNPAPNIPPVANAGNSSSIILPVNSISLDGSLSNDPDGSISAYNWTQVSGPSSSTITGANASVATASNLIAGLYTFQLTVTDNSGATAVATVKITVVSTTIQPPVANAGADQTITLPTNSVVIDGSASSASTGSNIISYVWTEKSGPSAVGLSNTAQNTVSNLVAGVYVFALTVTDNNANSGTDSVTITVRRARNQKPFANAGSNKNLTLPKKTTLGSGGSTTIDSTASTTLDGTASYDPDGSIVSYNWTQVSGPSSSTLSGSNTAIVSVSGLVVGQYVYQLTVVDNSGDSSSAQVKVIVSAPPNATPIANAGSNQSITAPASTVTLDGSASYDPDGTITAYSWVTVSGPGSITISNSNTAKPSVQGLTTGVYIFELTVTDNSGAMAKDQVTVIVNPKPILPNQAPVANAGTNQTITEPANSISLNGTNSFDPDGTIAGYSWTQISGPSASIISAGNTATPTVSQLIIGQYVFQLTVTDNNGATNADQVTITLNAATSKVNLPPVANAGNNDTISLPTNSYTLNATGSTDPDGTISNYQWQQIGGPATVSSSSMNSAQVTLSGLQAGDYEFEVTVTDNSGATSSANMKLTVEPDSSINTQLILYPNPAHDVVNGKLTSQITGTVKINVYDMSGKLVLITEAEKTGSEIIVPMTVSMLAPGMYTVQINLSNRKTVVSKFIKY